MSDITRADVLWHKAEIAAAKYCGSYGYDQEPSRLTRIIYELLVSEITDTAASVRDAMLLHKEMK